jgi:NhaP-type Na+/H+ or K+/H+ antiporter
MENFTITIFILAVLISLSAFADKLRIPNPVLLVIAGLAIGFIPGLPELPLDPDIIFLFFLPPLLAFPRNIFVRDKNENKSGLGYFDIPDERVHFYSHRPAVTRHSKRIDTVQNATLIGYGLIISLVTIVVRMLWVFTGAYLVKCMSRRKSNAGEEQNADDTWKNVLIVAWTGFFTSPVDQVAGC